MKKVKKDVIIFGGGIAGLYSAYKLSELGYKVSVVQDDKALASGPSVRNGGLLHRGTFHSALVNDDGVALKIAERCIYGYEQIKAFAPEAIEIDGTPVFAIIKNDELAQRAVNRWNKGSILYKEVNYKTFEEYIPGIERKYAKYIFKTADLPINYRIIYQKLLFQCERNNVEFFLNSKLEVINNNSVVIIKDQVQKITIEAEKFIFTTGYKTKELVNNFFSNKVNVKIWKSHALSIPRLKRYGFFFIDRNEISVEPQGEYSIVCQSQEDNLVDKADYDVVIEKTKGIFRQLVKVMPEAKLYANNYIAHACLKPSIILENDVKRSVDAEVHMMNNNCIIALPGKATEAPYLADVLLQKVFESHSDRRIAMRPGDNLKVDHE